MGLEELYWVYIGYIGFWGQGSWGLGAWGVTVSGRSKRVYSFGFRVYIWAFKTDGHNIDPAPYATILIVETPQKQTTFWKPENRVLDLRFRARGLLGVLVH